MSNELDVLAHDTIHVDVCPECGTATTGHGLDAPGHCPHGYDRRVPVEYVPASQLRGAVEALHEAIRLARDFNRGAMTWQEFDRKLAALESQHPRGRSA